MIRWHFDEQNENYEETSRSLNAEIEKAHEKAGKKVSKFKIEGMSYEVQFHGDKRNSGTLRAADRTMKIVRRDPKPGRTSTVNVYVVSACK